MGHEGPRLVEWTDHALVKAEVVGLTRADVERVVLEGHPRRMHNTLAADWLVREGRLMVAYNHPHRDDPLTALVGDPLAPRLTFWAR
jgi:hypothetical protein